MGTNDYSYQEAELAYAARQLASMQPWRPTTTTTQSATIERINR